jgi:hypothetical protein
VAHCLHEVERKRILLSCSQSEFASQLPGHIAPIQAYQGLYIGSERSFIRVMHLHGQLHLRGRARLPKEPRPAPRFRADLPN